MLIHRPLCKLSFICCLIGSCFPSLLAAAAQEGVLKPRSRTVSRQPVIAASSAIAGGQGEVQEKRLSPPDKVEVKKAITSIRGLLKNQYKDGTPEGRAKLIGVASQDDRRVKK